MLRPTAAFLAVAFVLGACGQSPETPPPAPEAPVAPVDPTPAAPAAASNVMPAAFLGRWDTDGGVCGSSDRDNPLRLEPSELTFYESGGDITAVRTSGADSVEVDAAMSGEGEEWSATLTFSLSEAGDILTTTQAGVAPTVRQRCQEPESQAR